MPELPEVETVRQGLAPHLDGAMIATVAQRRRDLRFPFPEDFAARLKGARIGKVGRRAKYLTLPLDTGETLVVHLGMTGRFSVDSHAPGAFHHAAGSEEKHTHLILETDRGAVIGYNDARRFGYMDLITTRGLASHPWFAALGPEPLSSGFAAKGLGVSLEGRRQSIKATLLDQRIVAGLGNIYVSESLYRAAIDPRRPAGDLSGAETRRLVGEIKAVLTEAIAAGGSTLRDYRSADGALGYFQHRFRVYGREGLACMTKGCQGGVERIVQGARSTFFCRACQA